MIARDVGGVGLPADSYRALVLCRATDGNKILHALLVKHYNDLLDRQSSEWSRDEVTYFFYFYVGDVFL